MTPTEYLAAIPRPRRKAERERLAKIAGCTYATMRAYTEPKKAPPGTPPEARRRCQDAAVCLKLEKATHSLVTVAEWNPAFAPLVAANA
jgi:hypothetical protein